MKRKIIARRKPVARSKGPRPVLAIGVCLIITLSGIAIDGPWRLTGWSSKILSRSLSPAPAAALPPPGNPSKEYIYAGGRLIATEEPGSVTLASPLNLAAVTISDVQINISWTASSNAHHYQIERADNINGPFNVLNPNVTGTTFSDTSAIAIKAYVYRVIAADSSGNLSSASNADLAVAIKFDDDPLPSFTVVKAQHILQLRQAINAARAAANLPPKIWFQNNIQLGSTTIMATDVEELRTALDEALQRFGLPTGGYKDPALYRVIINKDHIKELRDRVK